MNVEYLVFVLKLTFTYTIPVLDTLYNDKIQLSSVQIVETVTKKT